jgi:hypothetical protein
VFTAAAESEWQKIYATVDHARVGFTTVLTGYLEDRSVARMNRIVSETPSRSIDVGYRAWHAAPWLGRHGLLKTKVAEVFARRGRQAGLHLDISTRDADTLYGDDWYRFLASSKYTIGVEGGASLLDSDGSIRASSEQYLAAHPGASFEEVEANCFPGKDGDLQLFAASPRHLEACATRTCQILVEGAYNGVLRPGEHYIPLRRDLANVDDVIALIQRDDVRDSITQAAWRDVVQTGRYSYSGFVAEVERLLLAPRAVSRPLPRIAPAFLASLDRLSWLELPVRISLIPRIWVRAAALVKAILPQSVVAALRARLTRE